MLKIAYRVPVQLEFDFDAPDESPGVEDYSPVETHLELFNAPAGAVWEMVQAESDPAVLRILMSLHAAKVDGDDDAEFEAVEALGDLRLLGLEG